MMEIIVEILIYLFSSAIHLFLLIQIKHIKHSRLLHRVCAVNVLILFIWTVMRLVNNIISTFTGHISFIVYLIASVCVFFLPATLIWMAVLLVKEKVKNPGTYVLIFTPPVISTLVLITNSFHRLFIKCIAADGISYVYGSLYYIHCTWQLAYATFAVIYLVYFSLKYTNCLTKQILLVVLGIVTPIVVDYLLYATFFSQLPLSMPDSIYTMSYCFTAICLTFAIRKYKFLDMLPIAIRSLVDYISDSFVVMDYKGNILETNKNFQAAFGELINTRENNFFKALNDANLNELSNSISKYTSNTQIYENGRLDYEFTIKGKTRYFEIEIIHIYAHKQFIGVLVFFRDMTEHKEVLRLMEENARQMIEKARLVSLHNLIGGISHNIKSPLMSASGGILALKSRTSTIEVLLSNLNTDGRYQEYVDIIEEMKKWQDSIKHYLVYISDIITAVKDQTTSMKGSLSNLFTVGEVLGKIKILLDFELKKSNCKLNNILNIEANTEIEGDISVLTQILGNVIINASHSYGGGGIINVEVDRKGEEIIFKVQDYGKGIPPDVQSKIFNEMITTKGKDGSGLGLYFAGIAIKSQFMGSISLESEEGKGTTVYISIFQKGKKT